MTEAASREAFSPSLHQRVRYLEASGMGNGEVLCLEVTQGPGPLVPPHIHPAQEERFHVVEGQIGLRIGRRRLHLSAGHSAVVPPGTAHSFRVRGRRPARLINEFRPPLRTDDCFEHLRQRGRGLRSAITGRAGRPRPGA